MNVNQILNMILRMFMRKAVNKGINAGVKRMGGGQKRQPGQSRGMQQAKKAARMSRKIGRM